MNARYTVKRNSDFRRLYSKGKSAVSPCMVVYCLKNRDGLSRCGFTVSTKLGNAVTRNRIRRRLREIYRLNSGKLSPGKDIIVVGRSKSASADYSVLENDFLSCCAKLGILIGDTEQ